MLKGFKHIVIYVTALSLVFVWFVYGEVTGSSISGDDARASTVQSSQGGHYGGHGYIFYHK